MCCCLAHPLGSVNSTRMFSLYVQVGILRGIEMQSCSVGKMCAADFRGCGFDSAVGKASQRENICQYS